MAIMVLIQLEECDCGEGPPHCNVVSRGIDLDSTEAERAGGDAMKDVIMAKMKELYPNGQTSEHDPRRPPRSKQH